MCLLRSTGKHAVRLCFTDVRALPPASLSRIPKLNKNDDRLNWHLKFQEQYLQIRSLNIV